MGQGKENEYLSLIVLIIKDILMIRDVQRDVSRVFVFVVTFHFYFLFRSGSGSLKSVLKRLKKKARRSCEAGSETILSILYIKY